MLDKKKILVVDDEKDVTMALNGFFTALGQEMLTAFNGKDALDIIRKEKPALAILDIRMPGMDGIELIKTLHKENIKIKKIVITSFSSDNKKEVEALGVDGFFDKPVDLEALMARIKLVLASTGDTTFRTQNELTEVKSKEKATPKAKLLFMEPNAIVLGFTCGMFMNKEMLDGEYEVRVAYDASEGMKLIYSFQPDIVVVYDSLLGSDDVKSLAEIMLKATHHPKKVILHGVFPKTEVELKELEKLGVKYCNQSYLDNEGMKIINRRLTDFVASECVGLGLVKR